MSDWARNNPEEARAAARMADLHMEAYRLRCEEEALAGERELEPPEPLVEAIDQARKLEALYKVLEKFKPNETPNSQ